MNWKNRLRSKQHLSESIEDIKALEERRTALFVQTGQRQFIKAVADAELLQMNQQILDINNKLLKASQPLQPEEVLVTPDATENVSVEVEKVVEDVQPQT